MSPVHGRGAEPRSAAWRRWLLPAGVVVLAGAALVVAALPDQPGAGDASQSPADRRALLALLGNLKQMRGGEDGAQVLERARARAAALVPQLRWLLAQPEHELVPEALQLAGELGRRELLEPVTALAASGVHRRAALVCVDRLEPVSAERLQELLTAGERDAVLAGITIGARRDPCPVELLVPLLRSADAEIRLAVAAALPPELDPAMEPALLEAAEDRTAAVAVGAIELLGRLPRTAELEQFLVTQLLRREEAVVAAALDTLAGSEGRLDPETEAQLWQMVETAPSRKLAARAFLCFERTGSYDRSDVEERLPGLDAAGRYHGARLLVAIGERSGVDVLLELAQELHGNADEAPVAFACRTLLGGLADLPAAATIEQFREWFDANALPGPRTLPPPPPGM